MKICVVCDSNVDSEWKCEACGFAANWFEEFLCFSPELSLSNDGYDDQYFKKLYHLESNHFWFNVRNKLIAWVVSQYFPNTPNFLEIGCGTGYVLSHIQKNFPSIELFGSDIFIQGLSFTQRRLPNTKLFQLDARNIPFREEFHLIGLFDVLEHIEEDELVLSQIYKALHSEGGLLLSVPQHPFLWSQADVSACHKRRYTFLDLKSKLKQAGFEIIMKTSFNSFLLPLMYLSRIFKKKNASAELNIHWVLNKIFKTISLFELNLIKREINFPFGGSLLVVAKKNIL